MFGLYFSFFIAPLPIVLRGPWVQYFLRHFKYFNKRDLGEMYQTVERSSSTSSKAFDFKVSLLCKKFLCHWKRVVPVFSPVKPIVMWILVWGPEQTDSWFMLPPYWLEFWLLFNYLQELLMNLKTTKGKYNADTRHRDERRPTMPVFFGARLEILGVLCRAFT